MIEIIDGEMYGMYSALEASLGHEPSKEELLAFEQQAEKALNALLSNTKTETFAVLFPVKDNPDARKMCEKIQEHSITCQVKDIPMPQNEVSRELRKSIFNLLGETDLLGEDDLSPADGALDMFIFTMDDLMDQFNDEMLNPDDYFMSYVHATYTLI